MVVLATGFDAMTGTLNRIAITGRDGLTLRRTWEPGPSCYLGLASHGFPNLFVVTGPGSPSVLSNMVVSIEQHVEFIAGLLSWMGERGHTRVEADAEAERSWVDHVRELAEATLYVRAPSWYVGANVPGKPRVFMPYVGGVGAYRAECEAVAEAGYKGFAFA
jgi:cyclohexanone monooxygenase